MNDVSDALSAPTEGVILSLEQCDELLVSGMHSIRDAILGYTTKGLTQPQISERVKALGFKASVPTIQRHVADLRKEGLLPAVQPGTSRVTEWRKRQATVSTHQIDGMKHEPQPAPLTHRSEPIEVGQVMGGVRELQAGEYTHQDYNTIIHLFQQINALTNASKRSNTLSSEEWFSILGSWENCGMCIRTQCDHIERSKSDREDAITIDAH
jgi:hypothetical protein